MAKLVHRITYVCRHGRQPRSEVMRMPWLEFQLWEDSLGVYVSRSMNG